MKKSYQTNSEDETLRAARGLARGLGAGAVVALAGEIGSGKTVFIKGLCLGLGVKNADTVKSPTYVLLHHYQGRLPIQHFDLYRLEKETELDEIGFEEFLSDKQAVSLIEWADRAPRRIPKGSLWVRFKIIGPTAREILIQRHE